MSFYLHIVNLSSISKRTQNVATYYNTFFDFLNTVISNKNMIKYKYYFFEEVFYVSDRKFI